MSDPAPNSIVQMYLCPLSDADAKAAELNRQRLLSKTPNAFFNRSDIDTGLQDKKNIERYPVRVFTAGHGGNRLRGRNVDELRIRTLDDIHKPCRLTRDVPAGVFTQ